MSLIPGDPATAILGSYATPDNVEKLNRDLGLDKPVVQRYFIWLGNMLTGDFGRSFSLNRPVLDEVVERSLKSAALWNEVRDRLDESALGLSGGQQQRLVIARAIAIEPEVLLLDEPTSALDPISTLTIEELINDLKEQFTVVIVTHNMQQAARVSDQTAFMNMGQLIEYSDTNTLFTTPHKKQTEDYITGRYG